MVSRFLFLVYLLFITVAQSSAQNLSLQIADRQMLTYGFSDPSPVMPLGRFYPYHRFDGFALKGTMQPWKTITMQNDIIRLHILPEIGGKIWGAYHVKTGFPYIYHNDVVKFRDVAARGPWTSGGVELNFGDYGHAPTCATPVDEFSRENSDGSKSTFLSSFDWSSRTYWVVEVKLTEKASYFTTRSQWSNFTAFPTSNYQWMNAGFKASDDLEFLYPGNAYIDHDGKPFAWPVNEAGRKINFYKENNFGTYKSYHVLGETTDYFGGYWKKEDVGFIHYSPYYQKIGKKLWIWGLSRQGMIWEDLLTDKNGQYVELQSGRFFNQAGPASIESPFKYNRLEPMQSDSWEEKWMVFVGTGGHTRAFEKGLLHVAADSVRIFFHEPFSGTIRLIDSTGYQIQLPTDSPAGATVAVPWKYAPLFKVLFNNQVVFDREEREAVKRPLTPSDKIDWNTEYGQYLKAHSLIAQRDLPGALSLLNSLLDKNPHYVDALVAKASIRIQQGKEDAEELLRKALEINTYDGWANFYWGYLHLQQGDYVNAEDGFSIAATQNETKQSALYYLALTAFRKGDVTSATRLADECLAYFPQTAPGQYIRILTARNSPEHRGLLNRLLDGNPLDPFGIAESHLVYRDTFYKSRWVNELPHQNFIEMALFYGQAGLPQDALALLEAAPDHTMSLLWKAYYRKKTGKDASDILRTAASTPQELAFPFRTEEFALLQWAQQASPDWVWHYLEGKLKWSKGLTEEAKGSFTRCGNPGNVSFYLNKALLWKDQKDTVEAVLAKAYSMSATDWRVVKAWTECLLQQGKAEEALAVIQPFQEKHSDQYIAGQVLARTMFANRQFSQVVEYLQQLQSLPNEGASGLHQLFREACLFAALDIPVGKKKAAAMEKYLKLADSYPENLGSGQPYNHDFSLTTFIRNQFAVKGSTEKWGRASLLADFQAYLRETSIVEKEAFLAEAFTTQAARGSK